MVDDFSGDQSSAICASRMAWVFCFASLVAAFQRETMVQMSEYVYCEPRSLQPAVFWSICPGTMQVLTLSRSRSTSDLGRFLHPARLRDIRVLIGSVSNAPHALAKA